MAIKNIKLHGFYVQEKTIFRKKNSGPGSFRKFPEVSGSFPFRNFPPNFPLYYITIACLLSSLFCSSLLGSRAVFSLLTAPDVPCLRNEAAKQRRGAVIGLAKSVL